MELPLVASDWRRSNRDEAPLKLLNRYAEKNPSNFDEGVSFITRPGFQYFPVTFDEAPLPSTGLKALYHQEGLFNNHFFVTDRRTVWRCSENFNVIINDFDTTGYNCESWSYNRGTFTAPIGDIPEYFFHAGDNQLYVYADQGFYSGTLTYTGQPEEGATVRVGQMYYKFTSLGVDVGTPDGTSGNPWLVDRSTSGLLAIQNLFFAINAGERIGTSYSTNLIKNPLANAETFDAGKLVVYSAIGGSIAFSPVPTTVSGTSVLSWGFTQLEPTPVNQSWIVPLPFLTSIVKACVTFGSYVIIIAYNADIAKDVVYWVNPGETWVNALSFATAELLPDTLQSLRIVGDTLALIGKDTIELWYLTQNPDLPFAKLSGGSNRVGGYEGSDITINNVLYFVGTDNRVYRLSGSTLQTISDNSVSERVSNFVREEGPDSNSLPRAIRGWSLYVNDHVFYVLNLGTQNETFAFDITTETWTTWSNITNPLFPDLPNTILRQHGGKMVTTPNATKMLVIDIASGIIWTVSEDYKYDDLTSTEYEPIKCIVTAGLPQRMRESSPCNEVYLTGAMGNPSVYRLDTYIVTENEDFIVDSARRAFISMTSYIPDVFDDHPEYFSILLEYSDDNGRTWVSAGGFPVNFQDYTQEIAWRSLGQINAPGRLFRVTDYNLLPRIDGLDIR